MIAFLFILSAHWVADFVLQSQWMATNKSRNWWALTLHVLIYTGAMMVMVVIFNAFSPGPSSDRLVVWVLLNGGLHFCVDAVTSRISSRLLARQRVHDFFVVVGFDQLLHHLCLGLTLTWIMS